jgi:hypothetical protein
MVHMIVSPLRIRDADEMVFTGFDLEMKYQLHAEVYRLAS